MTPAPSLPAFRRVVVKVGSSLLVEGGAPRAAWLDALAGDVAGLRAGGARVMVVSSGAIALGRGLLGLPRGALKLDEAQAAASVGQIGLARAWAEALGRRGMVAGQVLITPADTEERRRALNARATLGTLLERGAVPVVNENDTVATAEIRYGDNDRLAARVGTLVGADLVVLLSDVDGLYTAPPGQDPGARHLAVVERVTPAIEAMAGGAASELSRGGMRTKVEAARLAAAGGAHLLIADGRGPAPLSAVMAGARCTWFLAPLDPVAARRRWIAATLEPRGALTIDAGAAAALARGASLLPAGVVALEGEFRRGDAVAVRGPDGAEIARGLVAYDAGEAALVLGLSSRDVLARLGHARAAMIHRDDLAPMGREPVGRDVEPPVGRAGPVGRAAAMG